MREREQDQEEDATNQRRQPLDHERSRVNPLDTMVSSKVFVSCGQANPEEPFCQLSARKVIRRGTQGIAFL